MGYSRDLAKKSDDAFFEDDFVLNLLNKVFFAAKGYRYYDQCKIVEPDRSHETLEMVKEATRKHHERMGRYYRNIRKEYRDW